MKQVDWWNKGDLTGLSVLNWIYIIPVGDDYFQQSA